MRNKTMLVLMTVVSLVAILFTAPAALADNGTDSSALRAAVNGADIMHHLQAFQDIALAYPEYRVAGSTGYGETAEYVFAQLVTAGYSPTRQYFDFDFFQELTPAVLDQTAPGSVSYAYDVDFYTMDYSGSGDVTAAVQAVDLLLPPVGGSTSGCEAADFSGFTAGNIALIQRGTCTFRQKADNAEAAGAAGVIIFNEGNTPDREPLFYGTLGGVGVTIPVVSGSFAFGTALQGLIGSGLTLHMVTDTTSGTRTTYNVIAETQGRTDRVVVVGAHLDSTSAGPGINDNGSGAATTLEIAVQMANLRIKPRNQVRFIWFSAEEEGLLGSGYYVSQLSTRQVRNIAAMLNFDMIASPVYERFVYDGDGSPTGTAGPNGSDVVEDVFLDYFGGAGLSTAPTAFDGRSDYGPFIDAGIPAGGLFGGAEGYDECYHKACDDMTNISSTALEEMSDAAAHTVLTFAMTTSAVNGTDKGNGGGKTDFAYLGPTLQK